jgi:hypothetical protein
MVGNAATVGVYDISENEAWVSMETTHETAEFAVEAIRRWWREVGRRRYRGARHVFVTADSGGSNSPRTRLWKLQLQKLADKTG